MIELLPNCVALYMLASVYSNQSPKRSSSKAIFKPEEFENASVLFLCGPKTYCYGVFVFLFFRKGWRDDSHVIFLTEVSSNTNQKMTGDCCCFKFVRRSVDGIKHKNEHKWLIDESNQIDHICILGVGLELACNTGSYGEYHQKEINVSATLASVAS